MLGELCRINHHAVIFISFILFFAACLAAKSNNSFKLLVFMPIFFYAGYAILSFNLFDTRFESFWNMYGTEDMYAVAEGKISKCDIYDNSIRITLENVKISVDGNEYESRDMLIYAGIENKDCCVGDIISAGGSIREIAAATNPGQFDSRAYYRAYNTAFVLNAGYVSYINRQENGLRHMLFRLKGELLKRLKNIAESEDYEVLSAMLFGDKTDMENELKSLYQLGGIAHILTISGLHISLIGRSIYRLLRRFGAGFMISCLSSGSVVLLYLLMTGIGTSSLRAVIMFLIFLLAEWSGKSYDMASAMGLSGIFILCEYPLMIYQFAFQMSVVCIFAISIAAPELCRYLKLEKVFQRTIITGISVQCFTMPVMLYHTYNYQAAGLFINLVVLALVGLVMISGFLSILMTYISVSASGFSIGTAHYILLFYKKICELIARADYSFVKGRPYLAALIIYYVLFMICLLVVLRAVKRDKKLKADEHINILKRYAFLGICLFLGIFAMGIKDTGKLSITFVDVGQGDSILARLPDGSSVLFDCGSSSVLGVGEKRIEPVLDYYGIDCVDRLFLSHGDLDHVNGAEYLISRGRVGRIIIPYALKASEGFDDILMLAEKMNIPVEYIKTGDAVFFDAVSMACLNPRGDKVYDDENEASLVVLIDYKDFKVLLTGDLDTEGERLVIEDALRLGINLDCDILKVGHHGSKNSSSEEFLAAVKPEYAVISCSKQNIYGHPSKEVLKRLSEASAGVYITRDSGAVTVESDGRGYSIREFVK